MRIFLGTQEITGKVKKDDILYTTKSLDESFDWDEAITIRIVDTDGSIETLLVSSSPQLIIADDTGNELVRYYYDHFYERTEGGRFLDARFRRRLVASAITGQEGIFSVNLLASRLFNTPYAEEFLNIPRYGAALNAYDTVLAYPDWTTMDTLYDPDTNRQFVSVGSLLIVYDWASNTKSVHAFSTPSGRSNTRTIVSGQPRYCFLRLLGFYTEKNTKYLYFVRDDVTFDVQGRENAYYTLLRVPTNFTSTSSVQEVKAGVIPRSLIVPFTEALKQDPSAVIPLRDSAGNVYGFYFITARKDADYGTIYIVYSDLSGNSTLAKTYTNLNLSNLDQNLYSRKSDCAIYDLNNYALTWRGFFFVRRSGNVWYYYRAQPNSAQSTVFYSAGYFKAFFQSRAENTRDHDSWSETWFNMNTNTYDQIAFYPAYGLCGSNAFIYSTLDSSYHVSSSGVVEIPNVLDSIKEIANHGDYYAFRVIYRDTEYIVIGKKETQAIISAYVRANDDFFDVVRDIKGIFRDSVFFHPTEKRLVLSTNAPIAGTITQGDYRQVREQAETLRSKYQKFVFADDYYLVRGAISDFLEEIRLGTILSSFGRILALLVQNYKKYEIISPVSYDVGKRYIFTDEEGRTSVVIVSKKQQDFEGLNHYEVFTTEYTTAIDYDFQDDQPSWLVLDYQISHSVVTRALDFEYQVTLSYISQGREHPHKIFWQVVDTKQDALVQDGFSWVSGIQATYHIRFTSSKLSNFLVVIRLVSQHAEKEIQYTIQTLQENEPQFVAPLVEIQLGETEGIYDNSNAFFLRGLEDWESSGFEIRQNCTYPGVNAKLPGNSAAGIQNGCWIQTKRLPIRATKEGMTVRKILRIAGSIHILEGTNTQMKIDVLFWESADSDILLATITQTLSIPPTIYQTYNIPLEFFMVQGDSVASYYQVRLTFTNPYIDPYKPVILRSFGIYSSIPASSIHGTVSDADKLDGYHASDFVLASNMKVPVVNGELPSASEENLGRLIVRLWEDDYYYYNDFYICLKSNSNFYTWVLLSRKQWTKI